MRNGLRALEVPFHVFCLFMISTQVLLLMIFHKRVDQRMILPIGKKKNTLDDSIVTTFTLNVIPCFRVNLTFALIALSTLFLIRYQSHDMTCQVSP